MRQAKAGKNLKNLEYCLNCSGSELLKCNRIRNATVSNFLFRTRYWAPFSKFRNFFNREFQQYPTAVPQLKQTVHFNDNLLQLLQPKNKLIFNELLASSLGKEIFITAKNRIYRVC